MSREPVGPLVQRSVFLGVLVIGVVAIWLRAEGLRDAWLSPDEAIYYAMATRDQWADFWTQWRVNAHPPLFALLVRAMGGASLDFGMLRSISLVSGCVWVGATFLVVREVAGRDRVATVAGLIASGLIAISPGAILMSQILRPYALLGASSTLCLFFAMRYLRRGGRADALGYALTALIALGAHYAALLVLATTAVAAGWMTLRCRAPLGRLGALALASVPVAILAALLTAFHLVELDSSVTAADARHGWLSDYVYQGIRGAWTGLYGTLDVGFAGWGAVLAVLAIGGALVAIRNGRELVAVIPAAAWAIAFVVAAAGRYPFGATRHSLYLLPILSLPVGFGLAAALDSRRWRLGAVVVLAGLLVFGTPLSQVLRLEDRPRRLRSENPVPRRVVERAGAVLESLPEEPGVVLLNDQTFLMLTPFYDPEHQLAEYRGRARRFSWGRREVVVWNSWRFSFEPGDGPASANLAEVVAALEGSMPDLPWLDGRATILVAGWKDTFLDDLRRSAEAQGSPLGERFSNRAGTLAVVDVDLAALGLLSTDRDR